MIPDGFQWIPSGISKDSLSMDVNGFHALRISIGVWWISMDSLVISMDALGISMHALGISMDSLRDINGSPKGFQLMSLL